MFKVPDEPVWGVLAAPPCTVFALSGNRWHRSDDDYRENLAVVDACIRIAFACKPKWWALENPVGTLVNWLGKPRMYFNPCDFGDPYTKRTCLWGDFTEPTRAPVEPTEGSKLWAKYGGRSARTKLMRSMTPEGFARAFFEANPYAMRAESDALWQRIDAENAMRAENLRLVLRRENDRAVANLRVAPTAA